MAQKKEGKITSDQVEDFKSRQGFDHDLAKALMPLRHPRRRILEHSVMSQQLVLTIRETIDGPFTRFVAAGAKRVPRRVFDHRPKRRRRSFSPRAELGGVLRFLQKCFSDLKGKHASRAEVRKAVRQAQALIVAVVNRNKKLAAFIAYS
jgi:hypothetical protein